MKKDQEIEVRVDSKNDESINSSNGSSEKDSKIDDDDNRDKR